MDDNFLISEIFAEKPYEKRAGGVERGVAWENISSGRYNFVPGINSNAMIFGIVGKLISCRLTY